MVDVLELIAIQAPAGCRHSGFWHLLYNIPSTHHLSEWNKHPAGDN